MWNAIAVVFRGLGSRPGLPGSQRGSPGVRGIEWLLHRNVRLCLSVFRKTPVGSCPENLENLALTYSQGSWLPLLGHDYLTL